MEKDKTILNIIEILKLTFDFSLLKVVDNWPLDLCAIGLQKGNKLVYISTFNFVNKSEVKYDYDLEIINESDETKINILKEGRGVIEEELIEKLKVFLKLWTPLPCYHTNLSCGSSLAATALDVGSDFIPLVGSGKDLVNGFREGNGWQVAAGVGFFALDVLTLGTSSIIKEGLKHYLKEGKNFLSGLRDPEKLEED